MKTFKQFIEAYSQSERKSHTPPQTTKEPQRFVDLLKRQRKEAGPMAPMQQIGPGGNIPRYVGRQIGPKFYKNISDYANQTNPTAKSKKIYYTNMPINNNPYEEPTNLEV